MGVANSGSFHHACYVVKDVKKAAAKLAASLSIRSWDIWVITPDAATLHGRPVEMSFRVALAAVGAGHYELIEPVSGESVYAEHLASKGEGYHHSCIAYESHEAMLAAKQELLGQGRKLLQSGTMGEAGEKVDFCYFEIEETGDVLELLYLKELPPPELHIA